MERIAALFFLTLVGLMLLVPFGIMLSLVFIAVYTARTIAGAL